LLVLQNIVQLLQTQNPQFELNGGASRPETEHYLCLILVRVYDIGRVMAEETQCLRRPGKLERRANDITEAIRKLILAEAPGVSKGLILVEIPVLNGGLPDGNISIKKNMSI